MKIIKRTFLAKNAATLISELESLKKLNHFNIVKLFEVIDDPDEPNVYLIMEQLKGGSLRDKLESMKGREFPTDKLLRYSR